MTQTNKKDKDQFGKYRNLEGILSTHWHIIQLYLDFLNLIAYLNEMSDQELSKRFEIQFQPVLTNIKKLRLRISTQKMLFNRNSQLSQLAQSLSQLYELRTHKTKADDLKKVLDTIQTLAFAFSYDSQKVAEQLLWTYSGRNSHITTLCRARVFPSLMLLLETRMKYGFTDDKQMDNQIDAQYPHETRPPSTQYSYAKKDFFLSLFNESSSIHIKDPEFDMGYREINSKKSEAPEDYQINDDYLQSQIERQRKELQEQALSENSEDSKTFDWQELEPNKDKSNSKGRHKQRLSRDKAWKQNKVSNLIQKIYEYAESVKSPYWIGVFIKVNPGYIRSTKDAVNSDLVSWRNELWGKPKAKKQAAQEGANSEDTNPENASPEQPIRPKRIQPKGDFDIVDYADTLNARSHHTHDSDEAMWSDDDDSLEEPKKQPEFLHPGYLGTEYNLSDLNPEDEQED